MLYRRSHPRPATVEELEEVHQALMQLRFGSNEELAYQTLRCAYTAVFDDYAPRGRGYGGRVLVVVYDGSPDQVEVYTWREGTIERTSPPV